MPAEVLEVTNQQYHADHSKVSASMLKVIRRSPRDYYERFVAEMKRAVEPTPAMILGSAVDALVFEPNTFNDSYVCRPEGIDGRTKDGKAALAKFRESLYNATELTADQMASAREMAAAVYAEPCSATLLNDPEAKKQLTVTWTDLEYDIPCKLRLDLFIHRPDQETDLILDLKTSDDPTPENWMRGGAFCPIQKFQYALQLAHYASGMQQHTGRHCSVGLIVVGSSIPHDVYTYDLGEWLAVGWAQRRDAIETLLRCRDSGEWKRPEQSTPISLKPSQYDFE